MKNKRGMSQRGGKPRKQLKYQKGKNTQGSAESQTDEQQQPDVTPHDGKPQRPDISDITAEDLRIFKERLAAKEAQAAKEARGSENAHAVEDIHVSWDVVDAREFNAKNDASDKSPDSIEEGIRIEGDFELLEQDAGERDTHGGDEQEKEKEDTQPFAKVPDLEEIKIDEGLEEFSKPQSSESGSVEESEAGQELEEASSYHPELGDEASELESPLEDDEPSEPAKASDEDAEPGNRPPEVLILVGSPHENGKSALFAEKLMGYLRLLGCAVTNYEISKYPVAACTGCNACMNTGMCCITGDAWGVLSRHMESCAALVVVAPVYFAGPSGWLKAALDRCQMYWARKYVIGAGVPPKRPAHLVVIGEGGDPFGTDPIEKICTSALNCANLRIEPDRIHRMIGDQYDLGRAVTIADVVRDDIKRMM